MSGPPVSKGWMDARAMSASNQVNHHNKSLRSLARRIARARRSRRGVTLLDVTIAATLLAIAITSLMGLIVSSIRLGRVNRESVLANQAARRAIEEMRAVAFEDIFTTYRDAPDFAIRGLQPQTNDVDGMVGQYLFPTVGTALREDVDDAGLGMPRDLNGDGAVDAADHAGDYRVLPVRVRVSWRGVSGNRTIELTTLMMDW